MPTKIYHKSRTKPQIKKHHNLQTNRKPIKPHNFRFKTNRILTFLTPGHSGELSAETADRTQLLEESKTP